MVLPETNSIAELPYPQIVFLVDYDSDLEPPTIAVAQNTAVPEITRVMEYVNGHPSVLSHKAQVGILID